MISAYTIQDANVFNNPEHYEVEIEIAALPDIKIQHIAASDILSKMRKAIRIILGGWQETNYPISLSEQQRVLHDYMKIINREKDSQRVMPKDFIGPSSISLEMANIISVDPDLKIPNIREPYTLTDKADGLRKLLFINSKGRIYLLTTENLLINLYIFLELSQFFNIDFTRRSVTGILFSSLRSTLKLKSSKSTGFTISLSIYFLCFCVKTTLSGNLSNISPPPPRTAKLFVLQNCLILLREEISTRILDILVSPVFRSINELWIVRRYAPAG